MQFSTNAANALTTNASQAAARTVTAKLRVLTAARFVRIGILGAICGLYGYAYGVRLGYTLNQRQAAIVLHSQNRARVGFV